MRTFGSIIIGIITGITIPIYDFSKKGIDIKNFIIVLGLILLWNIIFWAIESKNNG